MFIRLTRYLLTGLCLVVTINALAFTASVAIPVPAADGWHFIDTFVRKALQNELQLADFFAQRGPGDHSQPVHRLVLLGHLSLFDLDFSIEALVGIALGVIACSILAATLLKSAADRSRHPLAFGGAAAIFAVGLSLNATNIYSWSLVALLWISLLLGIVYWTLVSLPMRTGRFMACTLTATLAMALALDELALPVFAAAVVAVWLNDGVRRPQRGLVLLVAGGAGLVAARWFIHRMAGGAAAAAGDGRFSQMLDVLQGPGAWKLLVAPLSDSLVHQEHLAVWFPSYATAIQIAIAVVLAGLHGAFWWRALVSRERPSDTVYVLAVALMLFFYASIAGIALSRVTQFGIEYVHQPRYTAVYQLNVVALVLMFAGSIRHPDSPDKGGRVLRAVIAAFMVAVLALQWPLASKAWDHAKYVRNYSRGAAIALANLGADPGVEPAPRCPDILTVCNHPAPVRERMLAVLQEHRLSIYSASFRSAHGLEALPLESAAIETTSAATEPETHGSGGCAVKVLKHGPTRVAPRQPFNLQPGGRSAFWMMVAPGTPEFTLVFEGRSVPLLRRGEVATYLADDRQVAAIDSGKSLRFDVICDGQQVDSFEVTVH